MAYRPPSYDIPDLVKHFLKRTQCFPSQPFAVPTYHLPRRFFILNSTSVCCDPSHRNTPPAIMASFLSSFRATSVPTEDAPLDKLPAVESTALEAIRARLTPFLSSRTDLDDEDPWRSLTEREQNELLLRFLRNQLLNVDKAEAHVRKVATWRKSEKPWTRNLSLVEGEAAGLPIMTPNTRGRGNEILIFLPVGAYEKAAVDHSKQEVAVTTFFEHCAYMRNGIRASSGVMLVDFSDLVMKNVDLVTARYVIRVFMDYYPEVLSKILFINYPKWIYGTWKCLSPLLDARTVAKIVWLSDGAALKSELEKYFETEDLPVWLGGCVNVKDVGLYSGKTLKPEELLQRLFHHA